MQEHSGQVRGQARAPVGRYGGGWLWTRWTLRFPYDSTTPHPTFPTSALYRRHQSTQLTPAVACAPWAHGLERTRVASGVRSFALAISREPSHPLLAPQTERCHVFTGLWRPPAGFPAPLHLPTPALPTRRGGRSSLLCQDPVFGSTERALGEQELSVFKTRLELPCQHGAQKNPALLPALFSCRSLSSSFQFGW